MTDTLLSLMHIPIKKRQDFQSEVLTFFMMIITSMGFRNLSTLAFEAILL